MRTSSKHFTFALLAFTMLTACTSPVGPQESGIETPSMWSHFSRDDAADNLTQPIAIDAKAETDQQWWKRFNDPTLDALITEALQNNKSLAVAKARVEEARAGRTSARAALMPQVNAEASANRGNQGYATLDKPVNISQVDVAATWELDVFGKNQDKSAAATAILQSAEASQQAVRVALLAEVARTYFDMRNYERQVDLTRQNLETQKRTLELTKALMQNGQSSDFDIQRAAAEVTRTESLIPSFQTNYDAAVNRLNVLLGQAPGTKNAELAKPQPQKPLDQKILISAPANVLAERPDVRAAERSFAASISASDAATKELFPTIGLTAFFGAQTATPFSSTPWGLGANLVQPVLNFGRIQAMIDLADAQQQEAYANYQQTVLGALENMENALSAYMHETERNASLASNVQQNSRAAQLAKLQYENGYTGLLDVLVAERNKLESQANASASDAALRNDLVNIYAAAGGGWKDQPAPSTASHQ